MLNTLSGADVLAEDKLFATLDPVVRTVKTPAGGEFLLVDTVGFISKLPHALVDAFHSTLEEALLADVLSMVLKGDSNIGFEHHIGDDAAKLLRELMMKFCASLLAAALLISGALIESGTGWTGGFSWCGVACFALAIALLVWAFAGHKLRRK